MEPAEEEVSSQAITLPLIEAHCLDADEFEDVGESEKYDAMLNLTRIDLDGQRIAYISNLDTFSNLRCVTLRRNRIRRISGLSSLTHLEVLALGDNQIACIEGIRTILKIILQKYQSSLHFRSTPLIFVNFIAA